MSILFPAMLAGLTALALPTALHLIARHRFPVWRLPTVRFLQAERRANVFAWQLVDLPQLLLRLLVLLLLVLLMSRLFLPWLPGAAAPRNLLLVIDASASMQARTVGQDGEPTSMLERAKAEAQRLVDSLPERSRCGVMVAGAELRQLQELRPDRAGAKAAIAGIEACDGAGPGLVRAVAAACEVLRGRREAKSQIVVFSDLQSNAFRTRHQDDLATIRTIQAAMGDKLDLVFCQVGDSAPANVAIVDARVRGNRVRVGDDAHIVARLANYGDEPATVAPTLELGGRKLPPAKKREIAAGQQIVVDLTARMNRSQRDFARVLLAEPDRLVHDNQFDLPLQVADPRRILIVDGASVASGRGGGPLGLLAGGATPAAGAASEKEQIGGATIIRFALNPGYELGLAQGTGIIATTITPEVLAGQTLSRYDAIFLYDVSSLPDQALADLDTFVRLGRAVVLFTSGQVNPMHFNRSLAAGSGERTALAPAQIGNELELAPPVGLADQATSHPLLAPFRDRRQGDLGVVRLAKIREVRALDPGANVLLADSEGRPLGIEKRLEQGRIILFAFGVELERGNLARTRVFPPLLWRLVDYLAGEIDRRPDVPLTALRPVVLGVGEAQFAFVDQLQLAPVAGQDERLAAVATRLPKGRGDTLLLGGLPAGRFRLHTPQSEEAGALPPAYSRLLAVNPDPRESDLRALPSPALLELFNQQARVLPPTATAELAMPGNELTRWLAVLLILAYIAEAVVGWLLSARRERQRLVGGDQ